MPITEITKARQCGQIRFHVIYQYPYELDQILERCHLKPEAEHLLAITQKEAVEVLVCWLHRDAAYGKELMCGSLARELAEKFVKEFADGASRFFTNGPWHDPRQPQSWQPLTDSVFDGGVIIESGVGNDTRHVCLWFEDED